MSITAKPRMPHSSPRPPRPSDHSVPNPRSIILRQRTLLLSLASCLVLWAAFPPIGWWPLAWLAPLGWCYLIADDELSGNHPYRIIYLTGWLHWLLVVHWVRLPHWSAYFGWLALSGALAVYLPGFVWISRQLVQRGKWPLCLACAVSWCGLEWLRGYVLTGFSMALLGHTQVAWPTMIQVADLGGGYGVSFLIIFVAASLATLLRALRSRPSVVRQALGPVLASLIMLAAAYGYGRRQLVHFQQPVTSSSPIKVALIQGCRDTTFSAADDPRVTLAEYRELTRDIIQQHADIDLVVWPESMHTSPWLEVHEPWEVPAEFAEQPAEYGEQLLYAAELSHYEASWFGRQFGKPALFGCATLEIGDEPLRHFNSVLWTDKTGGLAGRYDKMHPVMFGEYVPLGNIFPWLYHLTPMGNGLTPGHRPLAVVVNDVILSPCICFENTVPRLLRRQLQMLRAAGTDPHVLVTATNDGWFWGSSQLDMHLACAIFRAVELRRPMLIAANTGFSAWIDSAGEVRQRGPRHETGSIVATVAAGPLTQSWYYRWGDGWAGVGLVICGLACVFGSSGSLVSGGK